MGLSGLRPDRLVLWIMTGSNGWLVSTLKQRHSTPSPPYTASFHLFFLTLSQKSLQPLPYSETPSQSPSASSSILSITPLYLPLSQSLSLVAVTLSQLSPNFFLTLSKSQSLSCLCLAPSSLSYCRSSAHISFSLSQSLNHSLVSASLPCRHRSSAQIAAHSFTFISDSFPHRRCSSLYASSSLPSFGTLLPLICFFFVNICKLIVDDDIDLKCWCMWRQGLWYMFLSAKITLLCLQLLVEGKSGFVSHTKHTAEATNMDLFHSWLITCTMWFWEFENKIAYLGAVKFKTKN